jgi:polysaccharide export outer membrane protein
MSLHPFVETKHPKMDIVIIRENEGKKTYNFVDISKADFINSPFYYLTQNDVVYVEPNKVMMNNSAIGPNITVILSSISLLLLTYSIFTRRQ